MAKLNSFDITKINLKSWNTDLQFSSHSDLVLSICIYQDVLLSGSLDTTIKIWKKLNGVLIRTCAAHTTWVMAVAVFDSHLYSGGLDGSIIKWNIDNGEILKRFLPVHRQTIKCFAYREGSLFSGAYDTAAIRWNAMSGLPIFIYVGSNNKLRGVVLWKQFVISSGENGQIRAWDTSINSVDTYAVLEDPFNNINCLFVVEDILYSGNSNSAVKQWNLTALVFTKMFVGKTIQSKSINLRPYKSDYNYCGR